MYSLDQLQAQYPGCDDGRAGRRLVRQHDRCIDMPDLSVDDVHRRLVREICQRHMDGRQLAGVVAQSRSSAGLIPIPTVGGSAIYGGTPADQSVVRCIRDLKTRGFRVVFYPFILMTSSGLALARPHHLFAGCLFGRDRGGQCVSRIGGDLAVHARRDKPDGRLCGLRHRLHLPANDPALRESVRRRRRRRSLSARLGIARS